MKNIRNRFSSFCVLSVCAVLVLSSSCRTAVEERIFDNKPTINVSANQTNENEIIVETVKNFWKFSSTGDNENLQNYLREPPEEFWKSDTPANDPDRNKNSDKVEPGETMTQGEGVPIDHRKWEAVSLKMFSQQIKDKNVELVNARVITANINEAVVKIDWRKFNSGEGWVSHYLLLSKDNTGWKVFMITDPLTLEGYNKTFGH